MSINQKKSILHNKRLPFNSVNSDYSLTTLPIKEINNIKTFVGKPQGILSKPSIFNVPQFSTKCFNFK